MKVRSLRRCSKTARKTRRIHLKEITEAVLAHEFGECDE
jgi:hypothetical protein